MLLYKKHFSLTSKNPNSYFVDPIIHKLCTGCGYFYPVRESPKYHGRLKIESNLGITLSAHGKESRTLEIANLESTIGRNFVKDGYVQITGLASAADLAAAEGHPVIEPAELAAAEGHPVMDPIVDLAYRRADGAEINLDYAFRLLEDALCKEGIAIDVNNETESAVFVSIIDSEPPCEGYISLVDPNTVQIFLHEMV